MKHLDHLSYIVGVALGDGNLSCPNGRAVRLRITCDVRHPKVTAEITKSLEKVFPKNKISKIPGPKDSYFNISVYSNKLKDYMPWKVGKGSKFEQNADVPTWIQSNKNFTKHCLRGLIQTDGSIYSDRGYLMVNFTNNTKVLAESVIEMISSLGYKPHLYKSMQNSGNPKYTVRLSKNVEKFISEINLAKG